MATTDGRRYRVLRALGRGGFGTVFHAEMIGSGGFTKQVALKVLNPEMEGVEEIAGRLRDEGRMLGRLRHRAIVRVDGLVNFDGRWAVVMEYVEGVDLRVLTEDAPVPVGPALEIMSEVASALHAAYETSTSRDGEKLKLLHRDLKPANIQLTSTGEVKVLDFGIARAQFDARESSTQSMRFGSLNYMSPERLDYIDGHEGDVYAMGAVLYEMLVGAALGKTSASPERHQGVMEKATAALEEREVDEGVTRLIVDCLAYEPDGRPNAREIHRRCRELRREVDSPWLSDWADETVPALMAQRIYEQDVLCGAVLSEASGMGLVNSEALRPDSFADSRRAASHETFVLDEGPLPPLELAPSEQTEVTEPAERVPEPAPSPLRRFAPVILVAALLLAVAAVAVPDWGGERPIGVTDGDAALEEASTDGAADGAATDEGAATDDGAATDEGADGSATDGSVTDGSVTDGSVTDGSVADGSVTDGSVRDGSVVNGSATDGSVVDGAATDGSVVDGSVADGLAANGSVADGSSTGGTDEGADGEGADGEGTDSEGTDSEGTDSEGTDGGDGSDDGAATSAATGTVIITGDASSFWLIDTAGARHAPGVLPAGLYQTVAVFPGKGEVPNGPLTVEAGGTVTLDCAMFFIRCK